MPELVCTDGGLSFCNQEFKAMEKECGFTHVTSSPYHARGNGKAEAAVKVAKLIVKKSFDLC